MLINKVNRYAIKGKSVLVTLEKYYLADMRNFTAKKINNRKKDRWQIRKYSL